MTHNTYAGQEVLEWTGGEEYDVHVAQITYICRLTPLCHAVMKPLANYCAFGLLGVLMDATLFQSLYANTCMYVDVH